MGEVNQTVEPEGIEPSSPACHADIFPLDDGPVSYWLRGRESNPHGRRLTADRSAFELPRSVRPPGRGRSRSRRGACKTRRTLITPCCQRTAETGAYAPPPSNGCPTWIRTRINQFRAGHLAFGPSGNSQRPRDRSLPAARAARCGWWIRRDLNPHVDG